MTINASLRWALLLASLLAVGPACSALLASARDAHGGHAVSMLVGGSLSHSLPAGLLLFAGAALVGWLGARFFALSTGFASAGLVLAWGAWRTSTFDQLIRRTHSPAELPMLAAEGAIALLAASAIAWVCWHASRAHRPSSANTAPTPQTFLSHIATAKDRAAAPKAAVIAVLLSAVAGAAVAYVIAATPLKGQTIAAAFVAAIAAGVVAQLAVQGMHASPTPVAVVVGLVLPAVVAPFLARADSALVAHTFANSVVPIAKVMPLDWAAGAVLGAPIGLGWAGAMMDVRMV
jgi:hypothetical protein